MLCFVAIAWAAEPAPAEEVPFGWLKVDARVPTELYVDGHLVAELVYPAELRLSVPAGQRALRAWVHGSARNLSVDVPVEGEANVLVGRTGVTAGSPTAAAPQVTGPAEVQVRVVGDDAVQVRIGHERWQVGPGEVVRLTLAQGAHDLSVRNLAGTVIWATGLLDVGGPMVLHIAEGRAIEVSGPGGFHPSGG